MSEFTLARTCDARAAEALVAGWREGRSIVNVRGDAADVGFREGVARATGSSLAVKPCTTAGDDRCRIVWAGPDEWFVVGARTPRDAMDERLRTALAGLHVAVTDVSSGYVVLRLLGRSARDVLAHGCPLDLHPRVFRTGMSAGSHFFKAIVQLWQTDDAPGYEMLVRRSYTDYVWLMLERCAADCGISTLAPEPTAARSEREPLGAER